MSPISNLKDQDIEARLFFHRLIWLLVFIAIMISVLIGRLIKLQILETEKFTTQSKTNYIKIEPDPPLRGLIYDRNNVLLVDNKPSFALEITPERIPCNKKLKRSHCIKDLLKRLRVYVNIDESDYVYFYKTLKKNAYRAFASVPIKRKLEKHELTTIAEIRHRLPGVDLVPQLTRHYIYPNSLAHIIGYVRHRDERIEKTWTEEQKKNYDGTTHVGLKGIEKQYEHLLHGKVGKKQVERNVHGRIINTTIQKASKPGKNIYLTIDIRLQALAEKLLGDKAGSIVALNPNNGEVLALVSKPGYDPNEFVSGIAPKKYRELQRHPKKPLYPRALVGKYPPGSTIKPFYALAALYYRTYTPEKSVSCRGFFMLPGVKHRWRDWKKEGHGKVDMRVSILRSCDVYYYGLAVKMGVDKISKFLTKMGFGQKTNIDMPQEINTDLPHRHFKRERLRRIYISRYLKRYRAEIKRVLRKTPSLDTPEFRKSLKDQYVQQANDALDRFLKKKPWVVKWHTGDTISAGIGQGLLTVTPLQLAFATSIIARRGKGYQPRLLYAVEEAGKRELQYTQPKLKKNIRDIPAHMWDKAIDGMVAVVHQKWSGTAWRIAKLTEDKYKIAGKTGTAQVFQVGQKEKYEADKIPEHLRDHALFIAFAPAEKPQIVVAVIVEHGGSGSKAAAPIAGNLIKEFMRLQEVQRSKLEKTSQVKVPARKKGS